MEDEENFWSPEELKSSESVEKNNNTYLIFILFLFYNNKIGKN